MVNQIWNADAGPGNAHLNPLRDREHGRVYVLEYGEPSADQITAVSADDPAGLVRALQSSNQFWRLTAQRLIVENQIQGLEADLVELVRQKELDATGFDAGAVHALWTLRGLNAEEALQSVAAEALTHPSAAVRKAAIETLPATDETGMLLVKHQLFMDETLPLRLAALLKTIDIGPRAHPSILDAAQNAIGGGDVWIMSALGRLNPIGIVQDPDMEQAAPAPDTEVQQLPPARLTLTAPETAVMQFTETTLRAFAGQEITIDFANLHSELHNAVFLKAETDVPAFGQALDQYMTDPNSVETEYIPPARQGDVLGSTGVIEQHKSTSFTLGPLEEGVYPFLCTVPGHWAIMQGELHVTGAPDLPRNDAGWTWTGSDPEAGSIVYLAGSMSRGRQSHHHARVFGFADGQLLYGGGDRTYTYTETSDAAFREALGGAALLALANNKPIEDEASRAAIFAHVEAGRPLLVTHPASWYNWADWPEYNERLIGGGSRSHEPIQAFSVDVVQPNHPLMEGVPGSFEVVDELYRADLLPDARAVVVAIGRSHETGAFIRWSGCAAWEMR